MRWEFLFIMKIKCGVSVWSVDEGSGMNVHTGQGVAWEGCPCDLSAAF